MVEDCTVGERIDMIERGLREIAEDYAIKDFKVIDWFVGASGQITCFVKMENPRINFRLMFPTYEVRAQAFCNQLTATSQGAVVKCIEHHIY